MDLSYPGYSTVRQTQIRMREWNQRVNRMLNETQILPKNRITIVDVFEASVEHPHIDNIHMTNPWYQALGLFFQQVLRSIIAHPFPNSSQ